MQARRRRLAVLISVILGVVAGVLGAFWTLSLESVNRRCERVIAQRNATIQDLHVREAAIRRDLEAARAYIATTSGSVSRLNAEAQRFQGTVQQLSQDVTRFQESYRRVLAEREQLIEQVLVLQQKRLAREEPSRIAEELRVAIRDAMASRHAGSDTTPP